MLNNAARVAGVARRMDGLPVTRTHLRVVLAVGLGLGMVPLAARLW
jgi:hypothetical protein